MRGGPFTRRRFAAVATGSLLARTALAGPQASRRVIALDWALTETLIGLGHPPLGAAEIANYGRTVVAPEIPAGVADVGLRLFPNPELMQSLDPDLVLINPAQDYMRPSLAPFGRVEAIPIYAPAGDPYRLAGEAAKTLAEMAGEPNAAARLAADAATVMDETRRRLRGYDGRPLYIVSFLDGSRVMVFDGRSLFQGVFDQVGLRNARPGRSGDWGFARIGIDELFVQPEARLLYQTPLPEEAKQTLAMDPLWARLPFVREQRVQALPPVWSFGALPSAMRIARLLGDALQADHG